MQITNIHLDVNVVGRLTKKKNRSISSQTKCQRCYDDRADNLPHS